MRSVRKYLAEIGARGGRKSRRALSPSQARAMVRVREARKAFKRYHARCFWWTDPDFRIGAEDVSWVAEQLKIHGDRDAYALGTKLSRPTN